MNRGTNTQSHWEQKHIQQYDIDKPYTFNFINNNLSYEKVGVDIIKENYESVTTKKILEIGCGNGEFSAYIKTKLLLDFYVEAWDFSKSAIDNNKLRCPEVNFIQRDFLLEPLNEDFGFICMFEVLEHIEEGVNYKILDNILNHCEYFILSLPTTIDNCFGEHISHYNWDTFENKGYNILWKQKLDKIDMSNVGDFGDYYHFILIFKGKLK